MSSLKQPLETDYLRVMAHELKLPLSSAKIFADMVQATGELNDQQHQYLEKTIHSLDRMSQFINDILEVARLDNNDEPLQVVPCSLTAFVKDAEELVSAMIQEKNLTVVHEFDSELSVVEGSPYFLALVMNNLVGNAVKYNVADGTVRISIKAIGTNCQFTIEDSGIGIPEEDLSSVFQPFFRSGHAKRKRIEGTGLGLALVHRIIELHQGTITVSSVVNQGTTFVMSLPLQSPTLKQTASTNA
ncbi:MAG: sensor histidine kinase [Phototrophicaceae bacterium]